MPTPPDKELKRLAATVGKFGCPDDIIPLRGGKVDSPNQIPYLDLLSKHVRETAPLLPDAVAEFQGRPVMYFIDARHSQPDPNERIDLQQRLANRGDHAALAVVRPGDLTLYPLHLDRKRLNKRGLGKVIPSTDPTAPFAFHSIATGDYDLPGRSEEADPVFSEIQTLLKRALKDLVADAGMDGLDVLSMTGRALFFRFLIDRRIVLESDLSKICPPATKGAEPHDLKAVFSNAERAAHTSAWLDETFNGDLLPLVDDLKPDASSATRQRAYRKAYTEAGAQSGDHIFRHLEAILRGWEQIGASAQPPLIDWDDLNFRHIPIGVLSQVYEDFSHQVDRRDSLDRSVHYTPRTLAKLLVDQALAGLETPHQARVLDPACGAGVFLVLALRELVRLRWEHDLKQPGGKAQRPDKEVIQSVLHHQIRGFDISESALRLAALGLYITVIELNEITRPPSEHHAGKALKDLVLFDRRTEEESSASGFVLGSLGDAVDHERFDGVFDVVVGNPPWTRLSGEAKTKLDEVGTHLAKKVLEARKLPSVAKSYKNPGGVPDLPFVWRAMEWARPGGLIAFALDARLILAQSPSAAKARDALFQAVSVTGVLNGSDLEKTAVWGGMDQAWILLWARNEKPDLDEHAFQLLTPIRENELVEKGEFRLDYQSAYPVPARKIIEHGWLCKALAIGTTLDVRVMEKLVNAAERQSVGSFWTHGKVLSQLESGQGFGFKSKSMNPPDWLLDLRVFSPPGMEPNLIETNAKTFRESFGNTKLDRPRTKELYRKPLLLIPEAPGEESDTKLSFRVDDHDVCFTRSFYGYSAGGHTDGATIVALLHIIVNSSVFRHFCYMRSARVGVNWRTIYKQDIDAFPFPILDDVISKDRQFAQNLANALDKPDFKDWKAIDDFVCQLFGLSKAEQQVVKDTVTFNGPYRSVRAPASLPTPDNEARAFARTLERSLQPFFKVAGRKIKAAVVPRVEGDWRQPWRFVTLLLDDDTWTPSPGLIADLMAEASKTAASRVVMPLPEGGLIVGAINKRRFWTRSRARLCAVHISREHLEATFPLPETA